MNFRIIALEVLESCKSEHSKNLVKETPYYFYKNYEIIKNNNGEETINLISDDFDLYSKDNELKISISAIVGKNGCGKSTLIELLIKTINNVFYKYKQKKPERDFHPVEGVSGIETNLFYKINNDLFKLYINDFVYKVYKFKENVNQRNNSRKYENPFDITDKFDLKDFFYTEVINYSLYAYNSKEEGNWITKIFHKNDAYQTPIVLNPFRSEGIININKENALVFQRLIANLLRYNSEGNLNLNLGDNLQANYLLLKLKEQKEYVEYYSLDTEKEIRIGLSKFVSEERDKILDLTLKKIINRDIESIRNIPTKILQRSRAYVLYKLINICAKYREYNKGHFFNFRTKKFNNLDGLLDLLKKDNSHITFKLRQTLNYLVYNHIYFDDSIGDNKIQIEDIANIINEIRNNDNIINYLPPPIFNIDIELRSIKSDNDKIRFSTLSSGEKQQIYSINSIFYHLINLDSVKNSTDDEKISYRFINIVLEEIELYFHPEYQRTYIDRLIEGINRLKLRNIVGLNFIFITHSPFILSDIPYDNIMYLTLKDNGYAENFIEKKQSFAANIYHLLQDNFFFENNIFIGEFAHKQIKEVIDFINNKQNNEDIIQDKILNYHYQLINLIDEPIVKNKLLEMFFEKFPSFLKTLKSKDKRELVIKYAKELGVSGVSFNGN